MALRIVFMGTPQFSVPVLDAVLKAGHEVVAVYTQPPRPAGRGMGDLKSPVHQFAEARGLRVLTPLNFKLDADRQDFSALKSDAAVVVAYGLLLPEPVLNAPRLGCFNVHASKLPRWRGAAPIQRAIMAGDKETAVAIMRMEKGLDTGPVCLSKTLPIDNTTTAGQLHDHMSIAGAALMVEALQQLQAGHLHAVPQPEDGVTYAAKIDKSEARIDFSRPAHELVHHIHGLSPFPGAWFEISGAPPERVKVLAVEVVKGNGAPGEILDDKLTIACGSGAISLKTVQRAGKKAMPTSEFLRGAKLGRGALLQ